MQWKWKACYVPCQPFLSRVPFLLSLTLQIPQATVHSSLVAEAWLAWQSMQRSMMWLRQMAQLSTTMSHAQSATAFHWLSCQYDFKTPLMRHCSPTFLTSNLFLPSVSPPLVPTFFGFGAASVISTSAMLFVSVVFDMW